LFSLFQRGKDEVDFVMPHSPQDHLWTVKKISADKWLEKKGLENYNLSVHVDATFLT
jgi:hypothetical protein